jgi:HlyD family secretion protein
MQPQHLARRSRSRSAWWLLSVPVVLGAMLVPFGGLWRPGDSTATLEGATVRRGPLRIAVHAGGSLRAAETISLKSGVEGRTTILSLVPEGTNVKKGDVVCELDATAMVEKRIEQSISGGNAEAALVKARQTHQIQESQNHSDIQAAQQKIEFAEQDLQMFEQGERDSDLEKAQQAIDLAREEAQRTKDHLTWSEKLAEQRFLTATELEADRIAQHRADVALQQATRDKSLLERFRLPRKDAELKAALEEARRECERVQLQAKARIVDFESDVRTCEARLELEQEKLRRLDAQIEKASIRAPGDGFVVYAQRDSDEPPIQEGSEVREREEILSIPSTDGMIAEMKLHESVLKQVEIGQPVSVKVDALPGSLFDGQVSFVAMLPDQNSRWTNPNARVYRSDAAITSAKPGMRPGMSCSVEILIEELPDAIHVPVQAVFRTQRENVSYVKQGGEIERRVVRIGRYNELWVQVLEGLEEGEVVLLHEPAGIDEPAVQAAEAPAEEVEAAKPPAGGTSTTDPHR